MSVATYTPVHEEITVACAEAGIPVVYCEKPLASTVAQAETMVEACRRTGTLLVVNHNRRFHPNFRRLRDAVAEGAIGSLTSVTTRWPSGRLGNVGTHIIDAVLMLTGRTPVAVSGTLDLSHRPDCRGTQFDDPGGWGVIRLEDGCMVTVDAADYATCPMVIELSGTEGTARVVGKEVTLNRAGETSEVWREVWREVWKHETGSRSSMDVAVEEIVRWLDARDSAEAERFPYDAVEAKQTLEAIVGFHVSHERNGAWVELPLEAAEKDRVLKTG